MKYTWHVQPLVSGSWSCGFRTSSAHRSASSAVPALLHPTQQTAPAWRRTSPTRAPGSGGEVPGGRERRRPSHLCGKETREGRSWTKARWTKQTICWANLLLTKHFFNNRNNMPVVFNDDNKLPALPPSVAWCSERDTIIPAFVVS